MDLTRNYTDKELERIEKRLRTEYLKASAEMQEKFKKRMESFRVRDEIMRKRWLSDSISKEEYLSWRSRALFSGQWVGKISAQLAKDLSVLNGESTAKLAEHLPRIYGESLNILSFEYAVAAGVSFSLYDKRTAELLASSERIWQPKYDGNKDKKWNARRFNNAITQSILQGESIPNAAKRIRSVVDADYKQSVRAARTAVNSVENAARFEKGKELKAMGFEVEKEWIATHDARTRLSHRYYDGMIIDLDAEFNRNLRYAGDMEAEPEELYNCRCTTAILLDGERVGEIQDISDIERWQKAYEDWKSGADIVEERGAWF